MLFKKKLINKHRILLLTTNKITHKRTLKRIHQKIHTNKTLKIIQKKKTHKKRHKKRTLKIKHMKKTHNMAKIIS